jgi:D-sedoheptulose 7-phosphate isomerase
MESVAAEAEVFIRDYIGSFTSALNSLDLETITQIVETLWDAYQNDQQIFFCGNGGSAASASHIVTDLTKGALGHRGDGLARPVRAFSLTDNLALVTAWANDVGYDSVFLGQLRPYLREGDVVVAISASGNSENVVRAVRYAREAGATTIALTGFGGGRLAKLADLSIVIDSNHYGVIEDLHLQIGHLICYFFRQLIEEKLAAVPVAG